MFETDYDREKAYWNSYIWTADKDVNESDPRSDVHYLGSSENKAWKKIQARTGFEPMTSAIPVLIVALHRAYCCVTIVYSIVLLIYFPK